MRLADSLTSVCPLTSVLSVTGQLLLLSSERD